MHYIYTVKVDQVDSEEKILVKVDCVFEVGAVLRRDHGPAQNICIPGLETVVSLMRESW
jgi:hypothetical protein